MFSKQKLFCCICGITFEAAVQESWHKFEHGVCSEKCFKIKKQMEYKSIMNLGGISC